MLVNQDTVLLGSKVILVPYTKEHVKKYHEWMLDDRLRELTASEPLTLDEEYQMQRRWRDDDDKLTFIILSRPPASELPQLTPTAFATDPAFPMIGDVNMFFKAALDDDEELEVEVEVMIAEPAYRRQGRAREALSLLIAYAKAPPLSVPHSVLLARIAEDNKPSIALFETLGFRVVKRVDAFREVEMRWRGAEA
ncbi:acyl-CoA N-acyltransferase [Neolentinus lepideus HHB14362 ss-1]|uniref:Acyl-CoA N-acyltransferase n=1 Tax=Neolentinus lepideus HHB14362 ss-1 TaxID=1314782 RepID=A0A165MGU5_9AGAM|nr:acyl-CoA N-acyltransferase [Neolentinus lepideus HHB14362 ss-1]